jgi:hypothetical protein
MRRGWRGLVSGVAGDSILKNALLESLTLHARSLRAFLYGAKRWPDDVVAGDFVLDWVSQRPAEPAALAKVEGRVG